MEEKIVKISELNAKSKNEIMKLSYKNRCLAPCNIEIREEEIKFIYDLENLKNVSEIRKARAVEKLRLLINASNVFDIASEYKIDISSDNVYYDYNFNVKLKDRDINLKEEIIDTERLILKYKSLIGYVFSKDYEYDDFYNGGIDLLKKNKIVEKYMDFQSIEEIKNELMKDLKEKELYDSENIVEVSGKEFKRKKYSIYGMSAVLALLSLYTIFASVFLIPVKNKIIEADNHFINKEYTLVIGSLKSTRGIPLNTSAKYKLAYSYVSVEDNLKQSRKDNILASISEKTDENILDYWIAIGKFDYDKAIDLGLKVRDDEYTLYAYVRKKNSLDANTKLSGEEKEKQLNEVDSKIKEYKEKVTDEDSLMNDTNSSQNTDTSSSSTTNSSSGTTTNSTDASGNTNAAASGTTTNSMSGIFSSTPSTQTSNGTTNSTTSTGN